MSLTTTGIVGSASNMYKPSGENINILGGSDKGLTSTSISPTDWVGAMSSNDGTSVMRTMTLNCPDECSCGRTVIL